MPEESKTESKTECKEAKDVEDSVVAKLDRFIKKNPLFKSAIKRFFDEHCAAFTGEDGEEHKLEWTTLHEQFVEIVENALALFISKTKGADEALLLRELASSEEHRDLLEALVAKADYMEFCSAMRGHRRRELQKQFDGMLLGSGADKK